MIFLTLRHSVFILFLFLLCYFGYGQTSNSGDLFVSDSSIFSSISPMINQTSGTVINDGKMYLYSDLQNDGTFSFSQNNNKGQVLFEGNDLQSLSGINTTYFNKIVFNSASNINIPFSINNDITIAGNTYFTNGIVQVIEPGGEVVFEDNATHSGNYEQSFIQGKVKKNGNDAFTFPIGDMERYRYAAISSPVSTIDQFSGEYFFQNISNNILLSLETESDIIEIDHQEYWHITKNAGASNVVLTLSWDENGTTPPEVYTEPLKNIRILRWDSTLQYWVNEGGIVDEVSKTVTTPIELEDYGFFTLGRINDNNMLTDDMIYNGVTPNGDGKNDYFIIGGIENLNNNRVMIYNRWGAKVFETENYDSDGNVFNGYSDHHLTFNGNDQLPTGTYYYVITYELLDSEGETTNEKKVGYLYLTTE